jgi:hypothetical protein
MMHCLLVFVPGLARRMAGPALMPRTWQWLHGAAVANLAVSFPCLPAVVRATVLTGQRPARHGVLGTRSLPPSPSAPSWTAPAPQGAASPLWLAQRLALARPQARLCELGASVECAPAHDGAVSAQDAALIDARHVDHVRRAWGREAPQLLVLSLRSLAAALRAAPPDSTPVREAASALDVTLDGLFGARPRGTAAMLCAAPGFGAVARRVKWPQTVRGVVEGCSVVEGPLARLRPPAGARELLRRELLLTPGIERILEEDALASWGIDHPQAGDLVVLAEPDAILEEGRPADALPRSAAGHPDPCAAGEPWAAWLADGVAAAWPEQVHDYRLGATLVAALGLPLTSLADQPLPL